MENIVTTRYKLLYISTYALKCLYFSFSIVETRWPSINSLYHYRSRHHFVSAVLLYTPSTTYLYFVTFHFVMNCRGNLVLYHKATKARYFGPRRS